MPNATPNLDTIFIEAIEISGAADRAAYLDRACGSDDFFRKRVGALVAAHFRAGGNFLERPAADADSTVGFAPTSDDTAAVLKAGTVIGQYVLREQIGEGGMGLVFVAEQTHPVRRKVALKVIKPGMDSRQVVARFEAERQALALMAHPNIAKVLDAGTTPKGRPYFVMELVKGEPITDYCDRNRLTLRQRLEVFLQVCQAVQHAHQKGVIHRDLKPSNILIEVHDVSPVAKVIDFGIAKAVGQSLTDKTMYTAFTQMMGTPLYMSPEQAGQSSLDVDTRTDVYALGVLLYELMTGTTPIDPVTFRKAGLDEVRRIIREDEPPRPSARMSTLKAAELSTVAEKRGADPHRLTRQVRGELDWVVMKCLEKDRNRRYESTSALAADVQRYLADESVMACPPSTAYRLRKFTRRNKAALVTLSLVALSLVAGTAASAWQAVEADRARKYADERLQEELKAKAEADKQSERAAEHYRRARAAVRQMLTRVATDEVGRIPQMKEVRRKLLEDAIAFYTELLKLDHRDSEAYFERGKVYKLLLRYDEAVRDYEATLALDTNHLECHVSLGWIWCYSLGDKWKDNGRALVHYKRAVELDYPGRVASGDEFESHTLRFWVAWNHVKLGNSAECRHWLQEYLELAPPSAATSWDTATLYLPLGETEMALGHARKAVGQDPNAPWARYILAKCLNSAGRTEEALAEINEAIRLNTWPHEHASAAYYLTRASFYLDRKDSARALADLNRVDEIRSLEWYEYKRRAVCHFDLGDSKAALADIASAVDKNPEDASTLTWIGPEAIAACPDANFRQGMIGQATRAIELTQGSPNAHAARAALYEAMNDDAKAREDWDAAIAGYKRRLAELEGKPGSDRDNAWTQLAGVQALLGHSLLRQKQYAEAEPILRESLSTREKLLPDSWLRFNAMSLLGGSLLGQKRHAEADPLLLQGYEGLKQREKQIPPNGTIRLPEAVERLVQLSEATHRPEKAKEWRKKLPIECAPPPRLK